MGAEYRRFLVLLACAPQLAPLVNGRAKWSRTPKPQKVILVTVTN